MTKPTLTTLNTIVFGMWCEGPCCAAVAAFRRADDTLLTDVVLTVGLCNGWTMLCNVLADVEIVGAEHLVIVCNDAALVGALIAMRAPEPDMIDRHWAVGWGDEGQRGGWVNVGYGGDIAHWAVLRMLGVNWAGRWRVMHSEKIERARELWRQHMSKNSVSRT